MKTKKEIERLLKLLNEERDSIDIPSVILHEIFIGKSNLTFMKGGIWTYKKGLMDALNWCKGCGEDYSCYFEGYIDALKWYLELKEK